MVYVSIYLYCASIYNKIATWFAGEKFRKKVTNIDLNKLKYLEKISLHYASRNGHQPVVQLLLDRGANIHEKDEDGEFITSIYMYSLYN